MNRVTRKVVLAATAAVAVASALPATVAAAEPNAVVRWNEVAAGVITSDPQRGTPSAASLYFAITQVAVYDAVMAIEGSHEPYAFEGTAAPEASVDAAVATAARDVLVEYFPKQASTIDAAYDRALAAVPDGASEDEGVAVGAASADAIIALRASDGRDANVPVVEGAEPGQWRRTSAGSVVTPYVGQVQPFLVESPQQFRPKGPNPLTSHQYAVEFERTRLYGAKTGSLRSQEQTEIALFWTENTIRQYNRALRQLAVERQLTVAETAVLFAMTDVPAADAMITCWNTKFHYSAWRPVTAIRNADGDGNPWTVADPAWEPLSPTALHPEYTSGHACLTGAITRGLEEFLGTKKIEFSMDSTALPGRARHEFATVDDLRRQVEDARVFGGDHFTTGGVDGTALGDDVAKWALKRFFEEV